jgi:Galactose oxidase, central domain
MSTRPPLTVLLLVLVSCCVLLQTHARAGAKPGARVKGPGANLKQIVIWGSECKQPEGKGLAFGGQHQRAGDGRPHTRLFEGGKWVVIHEELRKKNPLQKHHDAIWKLRTRFKNSLGRGRHIFFQGMTAGDERAFLEKEVNPELKKLAAELAALVKTLGGLNGLGKYESGQVKFALEKIRTALSTVSALKNITDAKILAAMRQAQIKMELAAEALGAEPPPRACSKVVYDTKTKLYVIFGGDHFDYLTNDIWVFDPAKKKWQQRHPKSAPQPRAAHKATAPGDGTLRVASGINYRSKIGYMAPCYWQLGGAEWVYDLAADSWKAPTGEKSFPSDARSYRTGPYAPEYYMGGERPNAAANEARLKAIPVNTWVAMKPPKRYEKNRDWGTSVIDPDHDLLLQWSGGHSSYGATDVAQYHFATNRWEIAFPVELPLGQNYSNSSYPGGFNFNLRPWMTGHTYKGYAYSKALKRLALLVRSHQWEYAHDPYYYIYDPVIGDWTERRRKPGAMSFVQNMYSVQTCDTKAGLFAWAKSKALLLDVKTMKWRGLKTKGKLPGVSVDSSGLVYDAKRDRVLFARKSYGRKNKFSGQIHALDLKTLEVKALSPKSPELPVGVYLREGVYHAAADVFIWGGGKAGLVAYDPKDNRWVKLKITGKAPFGHSTGHVYDAKRQLLWVVDSRANIWCLRLEAKTAGL